MGAPLGFFRKRPPKPKTYRLKPEGLRQIQWKAITGTATILAAVAGASLYRADLRHFGLDSPLLILLLFFIAACAGLFIGLLLLRQAWASYELIVSKKTITRKLTQRRDVTIRRSEILRVEEWPGVGLRVLTLNRVKNIHIPVSLVRYEEVKTQLGNWRVLETPRPRKIYERWPVASVIAGGVVFVVSLIVLIRAEAREVILPVGVLLLGGLGWAEYAILRNPHLDRRIKVSSWLGIIGLIPIVAKMIHSLLR